MYKIQVKGNKYEVLCRPGLAFQFKERAGLQPRSNVAPNTQCIKDPSGGSVYNEGKGQHARGFVE